MTCELWHVSHDSLWIMTCESWLVNRDLLWVMTCESWLVNRDLWVVTCESWLVSHDHDLSVMTCESWLVNRDLWVMTCESWHVSHDSVVTVTSQATVDSSANCTVSCRRLQSNLRRLTTTLRDVKLNSRSRQCRPVTRTSRKLRCATPTYSVHQHTHTHTPRITCSTETIVILSITDSTSYICLSIISSW